MTAFNPQWESPRADEPVESEEFPVGDSMTLAFFRAGLDDDDMTDYGADDRAYWEARYAETQEEEFHDWC